MVDVFEPQKRSEVMSRIRSSGNKETELAELLVENLTESFDPKKFKDEYMDRVEALIEAKVKGQKVKAFRKKPVKTVPNVLEALEKSLKQVQKKKTA